jgi:protein-S-isoprenylcysteine O-methyltransferase Ste14
MTPVLAKAVLVLLGIAWYVIRYPYERRAKRNPVARTERGPREYLLMAISAAGFGLLPFFYICFGFPRSADYTFHPAQAWLGVLVALGSLVIFRLTHRALGHFWSVSLECVSSTLS